MDIKPPQKKRPKLPNEVGRTELVRPKRPDVESTDPSARNPQLPNITSRRKLPKKVIIPLVIAIVLVVSAIAASVWYNYALSPVTSENRQVRVVIKPGETATSIAVILKNQQLIRSELAFNLYTQLSGTRDKLQAGGYVLSPNQGVSTIVEHMTTGKTDEFNITIPPGLTLDELRSQFERDGFTTDEITTAFEATYDHPLLADKPAGASLEGYIYPETYQVDADQSLQALLTRSFDESYAMLTEKGYIAEYQKKGLSIFQALTLASIVQKEVKDPTEQKQVAQVFLSRLSIGMMLGSDVTYMYAAKQLGVEATPELDSPYNTRKVVGLPPGPISNMNPSALDAVAFPAAGDFLYFVAGDDGTTHFARTEDEHVANVQAYCTTLCQ